jgi:hypothetical protein
MHVRKDNCRILHSAIAKHGKENFIIESICEVLTKELANEFEKDYIARYCTLAPNGYNIQTGGDDRPLMSEEQKEKLRKQMTGNKFRLGLPITEEAKQKLRVANLGKTLSKEHRAKIAASHIGIRPSKESIEKTRAAKLGVKQSEETKEKRRLALSGRTRSPEIRTRMRDAQRARRAKEKNVRHRPEDSSPVPRTCE